MSGGGAAAGRIEERGSRDGAVEPGRADPASTPRRPGFETSRRSQADRIGDHRRDDRGLRRDQAIRFLTTRARSVPVSVRL